MQSLVIFLSVYALVGPVISFGDTSKREDNEEE